MSCVMGLDIAVRHTGIIVLDNKGKLLSNGTIKTKCGDTVESEFRKYEGISRLLNLWKPSICVIENYSYGSVRNLKAITMNAELTGLIKYWVYKQGIKLYLVAPSQLKKYVSGNGKTEKAFIPMFVKKHFDIEFDSTDEVDGFVLAKIGVALQNKSEKLTGYQKDVLEKIQEVK